MINLLILFGIVVVAFVMSLMLFGSQIERHLRSNVEKWAKDAERKEAL